MSEIQTLGKYILHTRLAHGAMGEVWEAECTEARAALKAGDRVALKLVPEFLLHDGMLVERLKREAEAIRRLNHPSIVKFHELGEADGRVFMVLELLRGETLAQRLEKARQLPIADIERIGGAVADALAYIHGKGIYHRDLKPQNIFLTEAGEVKLIDLGVAKVLDEASLTMTGSHFGTPAYMSPESFRDSKSVTGAADVWSLGVILYEMATGQLPFPGNSAAAIIAKISDTNITPRPAAMLRPDLPKIIGRTIASCLECEPRLRKLELGYAGAARNIERADKAYRWAKRLFIFLLPAFCLILPFAVRFGSLSSAGAITVALLFLILFPVAMTGLLFAGYAFACCRRGRGLLVGHLLLAFAGAGGAVVTLFMLAVGAVIAGRAGRVATVPGPSLRAGAGEIRIALAPGAVPVGTGMSAQVRLPLRNGRAELPYQGRTIIFAIRPDNWAATPELFIDADADGDPFNDPPATRPARSSPLAVAGYDHMAYYYRFTISLGQPAVPYYASVICVADPVIPRELTIRPAAGWSGAASLEGEEATVIVIDADVDGVVSNGDNWLIRPGTVANRPGSGAETNRSLNETVTFAGREYRAAPAGGSALTLRGSGLGAPASASAPRTALRLLSARYGAAAAAIGDVVYVSGGTGEHTGLLDDIEKIDLVSGEVTRLALRLLPRRYHTLQAWQGKLYVIGGTDRNEVEIIDPVAGTATRGAPYPAPRTYYSGSVVHDGKIYMVGAGQGPGGNQLDGSVAIYDIARDRWSSGSVMPTPRTTDVALRGGLIYAVGGYGANATTAFDLYDITNDAWTELPQLPFAVRAQRIAIVGDWLYSFGDFNEMGRVMACDLTTREWRQVECGFMPCRHAALAVAGERIVIAGGSVAASGSAFDYVQVFTPAQLQAGRQ